MKIRLLILFAAVLGGFSFVQAQSAEGGIAAVRAEVAKINRNARSYAKKTKDVNEISPEGAGATAYSSKGDIRKITARFYGETFRGVGEYYYTGGKLIFAYERISHYDTQIGQRKPVKVVRVEEKRLYFSDGKLIAVMLGKKLAKAADEEYAETRDALIDTSEKLKAAF
jgi:hypothetical protein